LSWREQRLAAPRRDLGKTRCIPRVERTAPCVLSRPGSVLLASCALDIRVWDYARGCGAGTPVLARGSCQFLSSLVHRPLGGTTVPGEDRGEAAIRVGCWNHVPLGVLGSEVGPVLNTDQGARAACKVKGFSSPRTATNMIVEG